MGLLKMSDLWGAKKMPEDYQEFFKAIGVPLTLVD